MLGREHALSGVAAGAAFGELVLHLPAGGVAALAGLTGAFVTLPDLDQCESSAAESLGLMSEGVATVVDDVSGGHRHATHSIVGVAVFTTAAWAACHYRGDWGGRLGLFLAVALAVAAAIRALGGGGNLGDVVAIGVAAGITAEGWGLHLVALACAIGCAVHILGDMITDRGCPLLWPLSMHHFHLLPRALCFKAGSWPENVLVLPALVASIAWLGVHLAVAGGTG